MNGIRQPIKIDFTDEEKKQRLSHLMDELRAIEELLKDYQNEMQTHSDNPGCEIYANAAAWIIIYETEKNRVTSEYEKIHGEVFGVEMPMQMDDAGDCVIRQTHPDIRRILDSIAPLE